MKKIVLMLIFAISISFNAFANNEVSILSNIIAYKDGQNYNFEIKNAKGSQKVEIEVSSDGNNQKSKLVKNIDNSNGKKLISINQNELDKIVTPSNGYSFKLGFLDDNNNVKKSQNLHLGKTEIFRNYSPWAYENLQKAYANKMLSAEVASNVGKNITREELAEIAVKACEIKFNKTSQGSVKHFKDTDNKYVNMAYDLFIMNGNGDGNFNPKGEVTRQDYAVVISNIFDLKNNKSVKIKDSKDIAKYAKDAVNSAVNGGYLSIYEDGTFKPKKNMTREEVISSIVRNL